MKFMAIAIVQLALIVLLPIPAGRAKSYDISFRDNGQRPKELAHQSEWQVKVHKSAIILAWRCSSFQAVDNGRRHVDTHATMKVLNTNGAAQVTPAFAEDHTNIQRDDHYAVTAANISGTGVARMELRLKMDATMPAAGEYISEVEINVTAP